MNCAKIQTFSPNIYINTFEKSSPLHIHLDNFAYDFCRESVGSNHAPVTLPYTHIIHYLFWVEVFAWKEIVAISGEG